MTDSLKTPLHWSLQPGRKAAAEDVVSSQAQGWPCHVTKIISGGIVEVDFDVQQPIQNGTATIPGSVRMAVTTSEYERVPIQVGDKGMAVRADAYLGGVTGLGGGTADLTRRANLTALAFQPLGNTAWSSVDLNAYVLIGPNGVVLMDKGKKTVFTLTPGGIKITLPAGAAVEIDGDLKVTGTTTVQNINIQGTETGGGPS